MGKYGSLGVLFATTVCSAGIVLAGPQPWLPVPIRAAAGLALVLVLPGYGIVRTLFPGSRLQPAVVWVFSAACSLVVAVLGGLMLNLTPDGLNAQSWAVLLSGVTLGSTATALLRAMRAPGAARLSAGRAPSAGPAASPMGAVVFGAAIFVMCAAVWSGMTSEAHQDRPGFTQLWLIPDRADAGHVRIGLHNLEGQRMQFRLYLNANGTPAQEWGPFLVDDGALWEAPPFPVDPGVELSAELYRIDRPDEAYRRVRLKPRR